MNLIQGREIIVQIAFTYRSSSDLADFRSGSGEVQFIFGFAQLQIVIFGSKSGLGRVIWVSNQVRVSFARPSY